MTAPLTDIEATRLCAVAMGIKTWNEFGSPFHATIDGLGRLYNPLHDDAQAMALVKRFSMGIGQDQEGRWSAVMQKPTYCQSFHHPTLNAAIVFCVAAMERAKGE